MASHTTSNMARLSSAWQRRSSTVIDSKYACRASRATSLLESRASQRNAKSFAILASECHLGTKMPQGDMQIITRISFFG